MALFYLGPISLLLSYVEGPVGSGPLGGRPGSRQGRGEGASEAGSRLGGQLD